MWGCVEVGDIGIECDAHEGMHRTDDLIITEFVDQNDRPTADPDAIDRVLVTSLFGRTLPLIRYEPPTCRFPATSPAPAARRFR
jgi:phenylacetate-CoA ligase